MNIRSYSGFTLIEILVASFIFTLLGIGLVSFMTQGHRIWQEQESTKNSYSKTINVLTQIQRDLQNIITDPQNGGRLVIGRDPLGRTFFVFNRYIKNDNHHPILRYSGTQGTFIAELDSPWGPLKAGSYNSGDIYYFYPRGPREKLLPSSGKMEVAYVFSPNPRATVKLSNGQEFTGEIVSFGQTSTSFRVMHQGVMRTTEPIDNSNIIHKKLLGYDLYRGYVSPIDAPRLPVYPGSGSLFLDFTRQEDSEIPISQQWMNYLRPSLNTMEDSGAYDTLTLGAWLEDFIQEFNLKYEHFASNVIYVGLGLGVGGVSEYEDNVDNERPNAIYFDTRETGFPRALLLTVTAISTQGSPTVGRLSRAITPNATTIDIVGGGLVQNDGFPYVLVGNEWVYYHNIDGKRLTNCIRGRRGTFPTQHPAGTPVYWGRTLQKVIQLYH